MGAAAAPVAAAQAKYDGYAALVLIPKALSFLGTPYRYAAADASGMDCSGFVMTALTGLAIGAPRSSAAYSSYGMPVRGDPAPGDVLLFGEKGGVERVEHVGLYLGDGWFVHSASAGPRTGVIMSRLDESYWSARYLGARRPPLGEFAIPAAIHTEGEP